jgi:signal transduction histidine kinase
MGTFVVSVIIIAPLLLGLFLMMRRFRIMRESHRDLQRKAIALAAQIRTLEKEVDAAGLEAVQSNEHLLGSIGQDLHDGPIQLLSVLALKLNEPVLAAGSLLPENSDNRLSAREVLDSALFELRNIAAGLVLPELEGLSAAETLVLAIRRHEKLTGTKVASEIGELPPCLLPQQICLYRVVQESLNNAYAHALGIDQRVVAFADVISITIIVSDGGPRDVIPGRVQRPSTQLGVSGLRRRVELLGGTFTVSSGGNGTRVSAQLPITGAPVEAS